MQILNDQTGIANEKVYKSLLKSVKRNMKGFKKVFYKKLTTEDLEKIDKLWLKEIQDLDLNFLKYTRNVKDFGVDRCTIRSLYGIQNLSNLQYFSAYNTRIDDLSYMRECRELEMFDYCIEKGSSYSYTNFECLRGLDKLFEVDLSGHDVRDISFLADLKGLREVILSENPIENMEILKELPELEWLEIDGCNLATLEAIEACQGLKYLSAVDNPITDKDKTYYMELFSHIETVHI